MQFRLKNGFDIPLDGAPAGEPRADVAVRSVGVLGADHIDLRAALAVEEGRHVRRGELLFTDRQHSALRFTAPSSGVVREIRYGERRRLDAVIIDVRDDVAVEFERFDEAEIAGLPAGRLREWLLETGLWVALRGRPFERVPSPDIEPRAIFVTAIDTQPLAPDPRAVIAERSDDFRRGVLAMSRLADSQVHVCSGPGAGLPLPDIAGVTQERFAGAHPAGLAGTHIHALEYRVSDTADLWHIGYQDVIAIGRSLVSGELSAGRVISIGGPGAGRPVCARVPAGANLRAIAAAGGGTGRAISGSVLSGHRGADFLGRYHNQVTVLAPAGGATGRSGGLLGMLGRGNIMLDPGPGTGANGWPGGMLPAEAFERVWPFRVPPMPLLRAVLVGDTESVMRLGGLGLAEEDLALCTYICAAKRDYGTALRQTLRAIERNL